MIKTAFSCKMKVTMPTHTKEKKDFFMSNLTTTHPNQNMEQTSLLLPIQEQISPPKKRQIAPAFIPYNNQQSTVIFDIQELTPENHVGRIINKMVKSIKEEVFFENYQGGERSSYHPKMMVKVILYAYSQKACSYRENAKWVMENISTMQLAALQKTDYRTINRFRTQQMEKPLSKLFEAMIHQLINQKYISIENYFCMKLNQKQTQTSIHLFKKSDNKV